MTVSPDARNAIARLIDEGQSGKDIAWFVATRYARAVAGSMLEGTEDPRNADRLTGRAAVHGYVWAVLGHFGAVIPDERRAAVTDRIAEVLEAELGAVVAPGPRG